MDFFLSLGWYIIPFLIVLSVLVFVHELGHYLVARYNGVGVDVFSIGFGPELFGWDDSAGTRWKVCCFPLGGYVKMVGDADAASTPDKESLKKMDRRTRERSLFYKTVWQRIAVTAAGPVANYLFAILLFSALFATVGKRYTLPVLDTVQENGAAFSAGLQPGDLVKSINGAPIQQFEDIQRFLQETPEETLEIIVDRNGKILTFTAMPTLSKVIDHLGGVHKSGLLGISGKATGYIHYPWWSAWWYATEEVLSLSWQTLKAMGKIIIGAQSADGLGGPLRIAQLSGEVAQAGVVALIWFMALLSVNLGLINLFPIPMLDGGHLFFYICEVIRGKPVSEKAQEWGFRIGLWILVGLMLLATGNDLLHIFYK